MSNMFCLVICCSLAILTIYSEKISESENEFDMNTESIAKLIQEMNIKILDLEQVAVTSEQEMNMKIFDLEQKAVTSKQEITLKIADLEQEVFTLKQRSQLASSTAFTAFDDGGVQVCYGGEVLTFNTELYDAGNNYEPGTGTYTCPVDGVYMFSVSILNNGDRSSEAAIVIGGYETSGFHTSSDGHGNHATAIVTAVCKLGETVFVRCVSDGANVWGRYHDNWVSQFTGTLLSLT